MNRGELALRATALVVVVLLVASPIVGTVGSVAAQDLGNRPDFAGVPNTNIQEDLPVAAKKSGDLSLSSQTTGGTPLTAQQLRGSVMASKHADSLQVVVTTPKRAEGYVNGSRVDAGRGGVALVFSDDFNHSGRTVAVPASAIRGALGHTPKTVHGVHESGDRWADQVEQRNGLLFFEIPKFSSNSVTFEGSVSVSAAPATDGSEWTYELGPDESVSDPNVTFTGHTATEWDNASGTGLGDGATLAVDVAGDAEPRGPANGEPEVVLTGEGFERADSANALGLADGAIESLDVDGNLDPRGPDGTGDPAVNVTARAGTTSATGVVNPSDTTAKVYFEDGESAELGIPDVSTDTITELAFRHDGSTVNSVDVPIDIYLVSEAPDGVYGEGTLVKSGWNPGVSGIAEIPLDTAYSPSGSTISIELVPASTNGEGGGLVFPLNSASQTLWSSGGSASNYAAEAEVRNPAPSSVVVTANDGASASFSGLSDGETQSGTLNLSTSSSSLSFELDSGYVDYSAEWTERAASQDPGVDLDGDGTDDVSHSGQLSDGETVSYAVPDLAISDDTATISTSGGSTVGVAVNLQEVSKTREPKLTLNGQTVASYAGVLEDGATYETTVAQSHLQDGQNNLSVAVGDGSLSSDAPTPSVGLEYDHRADVKIDTSYTANGWEESYNVRHTYAGDRENVAVTIPFSRTVYDVRYVDYRVNGGDWITAAESNWHLENGTRLVVEPTDTDGDPGFEAGDQLEVRTAGYKVNPRNGAITITEPTDPSDSTVDAEFTVDNRTTNFYLEVGGTTRGDRVHYLASASWDASEEAVLDADGGQDFYLPNAAEGGSARVTTIPLGVGLSSGDVGIHVEDADTPRFKVSPGQTGSGDDVDLIWYDTTPGETYELYSFSRDRAIAKDTAESPVFFATSDTKDTYKIQEAGSDSGGSGDSGGSSGVESGGGAWDDAAPDGILQQLVVGAAWAGLVVVLVAATGRSDLQGRRRWILVVGLSVGSGLFSLEVLRPGSVSGAVNVGLQEVVPVAGLAVVGYVGYSLFSWWRTRQAEASTPDQVIEIGGGSD